MSRGEEETSYSKRGVHYFAIWFNGRLMAILVHRFLTAILASDHASLLILGTNVVLLKLSTRFVVHLFVPALVIGLQALTMSDEEADSRWVVSNFLHELHPLITSQDLHRHVIAQTAQTYVNSFLSPLSSRAY